MPKLDFIPKFPGGLLRVRLGWLLALGVLQLGLYVAIADLSHRFTEENSSWAAATADVLLLLVAAFILYLGSLWIAARNEELQTDPASQVAYRRWSVVVILGAAVLFRLVLWPSHPIQEIDIYRYLWDGRVAAEGVAPYRYSPADIDRYGDNPDAPRDLRRLAQLRDRSPALQTIFARVHHREVPSIYPPLSQTVFALAALLTPNQAPVSFYIWVFKGLILGFDLLTVLFILGLLRELGRPQWLLLVYAWCPLVLKEFANSGHLDSIAICLLTATVFLMLRAARPDYRSTDITGETQSRAFVTGLFFGAATLAKLYPLVLLPLFLRWWWRRLGWRFLFPLSGLLLVLGAVYGPLLFTHYSQETVAARPGPDDAFNPHPDPRHPLEGLAVFLTKWESNDLLFAVVYQNLRVDLSPPQEEAWFALMPRGVRQGLVNAAGEVANWVGVKIEPNALPMLIARAASATLLSLILVWLATRPWPTDGRLNFMRAIFLSLAWLWFLSPAQNPWCWCWTMPFVIFASWPWLLVSGATLLYYLRFWLAYHYPSQPIWGTMDGIRFFNQIVVTLEHLPVLLLVLGTALWRKLKTGVTKT